MSLMIGVAGCFFSVAAFAILLETPPNYLIHAGAVGAVGGFVYLIGTKYGLGVVPILFFYRRCRSLFLAHLFARISKEPVTVFLTAGILPTVPGAGMYRTAYYLIQNNSERSGYYLMQTLEIAGVIALAIFIVDTLFKIAGKREKGIPVRVPRNTCLTGGRAMHDKVSKQVFCLLNYLFICSIIRVKKRKVLFPVV